MAVKKSELYSSLWASCDSLCGGSQISSITASDSDTITPPTAPTKQGYTFAG
jgi:hypothetical protein